MARDNSRRSATVRGEYTAGEGWEAGKIAPSTKYADVDGNVSDKEPKGGGRVIVFKGDVVRQHMIDEIEGSTRRARSLANEDSPGDASHGDGDDDGDEG